MRVSDGTLDGLSLFVIEDMECENLIEFIKQVTPFLCYISSLLKYEDEENLFINIKITLNLFFHLSESEYHMDILKIYDDNGIESIKDILQSFEDNGFYLTFTRKFDVFFFMEYITNDDSNNNNKVDKNINTTKTYKLDNCICFETKPNVLFCSCGHICLCEKCIEIKQLNRCPICKTDITILRIIE